MKTFIFSLPARLKSFNEKLDVKGALCGKSWEVFNDEGVKQLFIFNTDGTLLITLNGKVVKSSWQYIPANSSVLITTDDETTMFRPAFYDKIIFALQQDGVERYLFMIDEQQKSIFPEITLGALEKYFEEKERKVLEVERKERMRTDPVLFAEQQRRRKEEEEKKKEDERIAVREYLRGKKEELFAKYAHSHKLAFYLTIASTIVGVVFLMLYLLIENDSNWLEAGICIICLPILLVLCMVLAETKADYVINAYEQETGKKIEHLDKNDIKQIYEEL